MPVSENDPGFIIELMVNLIFFLASILVAVKSLIKISLVEAKIWQK